MIRVGTSGWVYASWRGRFYPQGVPQSQWLHYYAQHFDTVELNATTYRLPTGTQVRRWCEAVPPGFRYTIKLSRLITHRQSLPQRVDAFIERYMERAACFEPALLAQILVQFPPRLERDDDHLRRFLEKLPRHHRYVVEFRHPSWHVEEVAAILRAHGAALCIHDYPEVEPLLDVTSPELAYVRLHGATALYAGSYSDRRLRGWLSRIRELAARARDVYVYFNNDTEAAAPGDAARLREMIGASS